MVIQHRRQVFFPRQQCLAGLCRRKVLKIAHKGAPIQRLDDVENLFGVFLVGNQPLHVRPGLQRADARAIPPRVNEHVGHDKFSNSCAVHP